MTNHIHILASTEDKNSSSLMLLYIGRQYMHYKNHTYGSCGSIWAGRYKSNIIHDETCLLTCMRYIELNPVRADMVKSTGAYRWTSY